MGPRRSSNQQLHLLAAHLVPSQHAASSIPACRVGQRQEVAPGSRCRRSVWLERRQRVRWYHSFPGDDLPREHEPALLGSRLMPRSGRCGTAPAVAEREFARLPRARGRAHGPLVPNEFNGIKGRAQGALGALAGAAPTYRRSSGLKAVPAPAAVAAAEGDDAPAALGAPCLPESRSSIRPRVPSKTERDLCPSRSCAGKIRDHAPCLLPCFLAP